MASQIQNEAELNADKVGHSIRRWLKDWSRKWNEPSLAQQTKVEFSNRMKVSLGRAYPRRMLIRLNKSLEPRRNLKLLREVLCHEAAHLTVHRQHGCSAKPHGEEWRQLIRLAGYNPRRTYRVERIGEFTQEPTILFLHSCLNCGARRLAKKPMRDWRCVTCTEAGLEGKLQITTQPSREGLGEFPRSYQGAHSPRS
ncbi:MAG: SprT-like domain-containing protein [Acidobacteriota bacterium]|nr:MAG: SprT-like domain-containing protein [Acidobacteriota bacterium]